MNKFENWMLIIAIPCYIWDWFDYIVVEDRSIWVYIALICLSIYFIFEIHSRVYNYKKYGTIWY